MWIRVILIVIQLVDAIEIDKYCHLCSQTIPYNIYSKKR